MEAFSVEDCTPVIKDFYLSGETIHTQWSLGLLWEIMSDTFTSLTPTTNKPFTHHGVLSTVSVFYPLGLLAPITIQGSALLKELTSEPSDWVTLLLEDKLSRCEAWRYSLQDLKQIHVPHMYRSVFNHSPERVEVRE